MDKILVTAVVILLLAGACTSEFTTTETPRLGEAVHHNMAIHILPQAPVVLGGAPSAGTSFPGTPSSVPGARAGVAMDRYMTGKVTPLHTSRAGAPTAAGSPGQ